MPFLSIPAQVDWPFLRRGRMPKVSKAVELNIVSKRLLLEHCALMLKSRMTQWECAMNIFYIIGVVVVLVLVASFLGLHV
jgi:hypothetical protein